MRKISKISLVAAVAVAGFSTANAQPLEEAIKNVDVSGSVVYRYDNIDDSKGFNASFADAITSMNATEYKEFQELTGLDGVGQGQAAGRLGIDRDKDRTDTNRYKVGLNLI